jgi:hypothetical protein
MKTSLKYGYFVIYFIFLFLLSAVLFLKKKHRGNKFCATLAAALGEPCNPKQRLCFPGFICTAKQGGFQQQAVQPQAFQQQAFQQQGAFQQNFGKFVR